MKYFFIILLLLSIIAYGKERKKNNINHNNNTAYLNKIQNSDDKEDTEDKEDDKKDEMDFSNIILESDDLDEDMEKEEEKEIDEEIIKSTKKIKEVDLKEIERKKENQKKENELFLSFLKMQMQMNYRNLILFENIPYQHSTGIEITTSIMGLELKNASAYVGEIGYRISYNSSLAQSLIISPLMINFNFRKWGEVLPLKVNLFKIYFFKETVRGNNNKTINLFFEYFSLLMSWRFLKDEDFSSNIFFGVSFGPDDIKSNPKRESILFTIGISGDFLPIKIKF